MGQMIKSSIMKMVVFMFAMLMILANDTIVESGTTRMKTPPDKAMLYVYRVYKGCQGEIDFDLIINGNYSFAIPNGTFLSLLLEPGKYEIVMPPNNQKNVHVDQKVILNANAGKTEYVMTAATCRSTDPNILSKVDSTSARYDLERLKLADPDAEIVHLNSLGHQANSNTTAKALSVPTTVSKTATQSDIDEVPAAKAIEQKKNYAIVIGIEQYRQKLPAADYASQDARLVSEYLVKTLGYPEENVVVLLNDRAGLGDFVKYFEKWLPNNAEQGGTVFVYYSGHGAPNPKTGDAYLVPFDGDPTFIDETGYPLKRLYSSLGKLQAKEIIVALDSCFSGAGGRSVLAKGSRPIVLSIENPLLLSKNMKVFAASAGDQVSSTYDEKGHGLFTYFLLKGIKNEDVVQKDGSLDITSLFDYVKPQVSRIARKKYNNEQTPQLIGAKTK